MQVRQMRPLGSNHNRRKDRRSWLPPQSLEQTKAEARFKDTKTSRNRPIILPAFAVEDLRRVKRSQAEELFKLGIRQTGETLACCRADGEPLQDRSLTDQFSKLMNRLKDIHGCASMTRGTRTPLNCSLTESIRKSRRSVWALDHNHSRWTFIRTLRTPCRPTRQDGSIPLFRLPNRALRAKNRVFGSNSGSIRVLEVWWKSEKPIYINVMERWQSGRSHRTRNAAYGQPYRGFKSLPLRQRRK